MYLVLAPPASSYAAVMHRKRIMGDKAADDAARAAAFTRGNRIKLSQVHTPPSHMAAPPPPFTRLPLRLQVLRQFPGAHDGRKIR